MTDFAISIATKISEYLVEPLLIRPLRRVFCFKSIVDDFKDKSQKLRIRQEIVKDKVQEATNNAESIYKHVEDWLVRVEEIMGRVQRLQNELEGVQSCSWCPGWTCRYQLSKQVFEMTSLLTKLYEDGGGFDKVAHPAPLRPVSGDSSFMPHASANSAFHQIMGALKKEDVKIIGLYGMGGIGKTTLAEQVRIKALEQKSFDHAVMVTVSQTPNVRNIQSTIADFLSLKFEQETEEGRASKLNERLKIGTILIILDDVWEKFELKAIGINVNDFKGCKVLLTTRRHHVCISMASQLNIQLDVMSDAEAWDFFKEKASLSDSSDVKKVAEDVARECKGLPIALATVGAALRNKSQEEWTEALQNLRDSRLVDIVHVGDGDDRNAYKCLRLSYDYLKHSPGSQAQFLLLLCSLFPEDHEIEVEDLARFAFGMGLFERVKSIEDARRKVGVTVKLLKDSCLLLSTDSEEYVKIHDVVRDVALWIGSDIESPEKSVLTVRDGSDLNELIKKNSFQNCRAVSFMGNSIYELSRHELVCPNLEIMLFFGGDEGGFDVELPDDFFKKMEGLKVLDFRAGNRWRMCGFSVPQSLQNLINLQTLSLRSCQCSNSSVLGKLRNLEILFLENSDIDCGAEGMSGLEKIRLLDLKKFDLKVFPSNVIKTFLKLEELYEYSFQECEVEKSKKGIAGNSLSVLKSLSNLVVLFAEIKNVRCIPMDFCFPTLQRYDISVGEYKMSLSWFNNWSGLRSRQVRGLGLEGIEDESQAINTFKKLLPSVEDVHLKGWKELHSLGALYCHPEGFLQKVKQLEVVDCHKMELVFEFQEEEISGININIVRLQQLRRLRLENLWELKQVWKGDAKFANVCNLTEVEIVNCPKLRCLFSSPSLAKSLQQLRILTVDRCCDLEEIISLRGHNDQEVVDSSTFSFQNLRQLSVSACGKLKTIFPIMLMQGIAPHGHCDLPKLEKLWLIDNAELEHLFGHQSSEAETGQLSGDFVSQWPLLEQLRVGGCPKMSTQFVATIQRLLQTPTLTKQLKEIKLGNIQGVEEMMPLQRYDENDQLLIFQLRYMHLTDLADLKCIWRGPTRNICFSSLHTVIVIGCNKLKQVFTDAMVTSLQQLLWLTIAECNELEHVVIMEAEAQEGLKGVGFKRLTKLEVRQCGKLKTIFPISTALYHPPNLVDLHIEHNAELEHLFGQSDYDTVALWPSLQWLSLVGCPQISTHFVKNIQNQLQDPSAQHLREITLGGIRGLEEIIQFQGNMNDNEPMRFRLFKLYLSDLEDLKRIWRGSTHNICFNSLEQVTVIGCSKLKQLFTTTIATTLQNLQHLKIESCNELEHVIVMDEEKEEEDKDNNIQSIVFPRLKSVNLINLPSLISFCPTSYKLILPSSARESLKVEGCPNIESCNELERVVFENVVEEDWYRPVLLRRGF